MPIGHMNQMTFVPKINFTMIQHFVFKQKIKVDGGLTSKITKEWIIQHKFSVGETSPYIPHINGKVDMTPISM